MPIHRRSALYGVTASPLLFSSRSKLTSEQQSYQTCGSHRCPLSTEKRLSMKSLLSSRTQSALPVAFITTLVVTALFPLAAIPAIAQAQEPTPPPDTDDRRLGGPGGRPLRETTASKVRPNFPEFRRSWELVRRPASRTTADPEISRTAAARPTAGHLMVFSNLAYNQPCCSYHCCRMRGALNAFSILSS